MMTTFSSYDPLYDCSTITLRHSVDPLFGSAGTDYALVSLLPLSMATFDSSFHLAPPFYVAVLPLHKQKQYGIDDALNMIVTELAAAVGALGNDAGTSCYHLYDLVSYCEVLLLQEK